MADQNDQQAPPTVPAVPSSSLPTPPTNTAIKAVEMSFVATLKDLWRRYSIFFIFVGALVLIAKFNDIISDILGLASKKDLEQATNTDNQLRAKENATNNQANALVNQANELPAKEGTVDENWNRKK